MRVRNIRKPAFSGAFYASDSNILRSDVRGYIDSAESQSSGRKLKAVISPHAGYVYSGPVAGYAYRAIKDRFGGSKQKLKVFILAPSHNAYFGGFGLSAVDSWRTPLGDVPVSAVVQKMLSAGNCFTDAQEVHGVEHSIEVQLPFLQVALEGSQFEIVPIMISDPRSLDSVGELATYIDDASLVIVSTDLSHYSPYDEAVRRDRQTIDLILKQDVAGIDRDADACGKLAVEAAVAISTERNWSATLAKYLNSGDTAGDKEAVVGYAVILFCA